MELRPNEHLLRTEIALVMEGWVFTWYYSDLILSNQYLIVRQRYEGERSITGRILTWIAKENGHPFIEEIPLENIISVEATTTGFYRRVLMIKTQNKTWRISVPSQPEVWVREITQLQKKLLQ